MGLSSFFTGLVPKRWRDRIDGDDELSPRISPDRMSGIASSSRVVPDLSLQQPFRNPNAPNDDDSILPTIPARDEPIANQIRPTVPESDVARPAALSALGAPPAPMTWNPIVTDPTRRNAPRVSPTATGDPVAIATRERDALRQWQPYRKRGVKNTLEGIWRGFQGGGGLIGAVEGGVGSLISPSFTGKIQRESLLNAADRDVARRLGEQRVQSEIQSDLIRPQIEREKIQAAEDQDAAQAERQALMQSLKLHEDIPFDSADPNDAALIKLANKHRVTIPSKYPALKPNLRPPDVEYVKNPDGSVTAKAYNPETKKWVDEPSLSSQPPIPKPETDYPTRASHYYKRQGEKEAEAQDLEQRIQAIKPSGVDANNNFIYTDQQQAEVNRLTQQRQEALRSANEFRSKGDEAATEKVGAKSGSAKMFDFSLGAWLKAHPGKTEADARAEAEKGGYQVVP